MDRESGQGQKADQLRAVRSHLFGRIHPNGRAAPTSPFLLKTKNAPQTENPSDPAAFAEGARFFPQPFHFSEVLTATAPTTQQKTSGKSKFVKIVPYPAANVKQEAP